MAVSIRSSPIYIGKDIILSLCSTLQLPPTQTPGRSVCRPSSMVCFSVPACNRQAVKSREHGSVVRRARRSWRPPWHTDARRKLSESERWHTKIDNYIGANYEYSSSTVYTCTMTTL